MNTLHLVLVFLPSAFCKEEGMNKQVCILKNKNKKPNKNTHTDKKKKIFAGVLLLEGLLKYT